ncbi:acyl carrier protein [Candidatus Magnetomorum sp. HK-1]|nr:acyl carrier protein [Candidatus Magnetomorum sp. HK-1]
MYDKIVQLIVTQAEELNEELENKIPVELGSATPLFDGNEGILNSIALVTLIVALEQSVEDEFEIPIILANEKAMSQKNSPFLTIGSLAKYIAILLKEENSNG